MRCGLILRYIGAYCELYRCSALGLGMGDRTAWLKCQQCSKSNVITFPRFCSLHICKLTPATCKVRTIVCSCGFIPSLPLFMGLTVPGVLCERRRKAYCSFLLFFKQKKTKQGKYWHCRLLSFSLRILSDWHTSFHTAIASG